MLWILGMCVVLVVAPFLAQFLGLLLGWLLYHLFALPFRIVRALD